MVSVWLRYGGGPTLARKVISSGLSQTELAVEVYPLRLQLLVMPRGECSTIRISKKVLFEVGFDILLFSAFNAACCFMVDSSN